MPMTRRQYLRNSLLAGAAAALPGGLLRALEHADIITRAVPATGEALPIVGLGTSATFRNLAEEGRTDPLLEVMKLLVKHGGTVLDTAPSYDNAEAVCGDLARAAGLSDDLFWATKINVVPRGSNERADHEKARTQLRRSFERIGKHPVDLVQVHDVADIPGHMPIIREHKEAGNIRYIGVTSTRKHQYETLEKAMRDYPLDFIGIDYAVDNRSAADRILPLAEERGIAVLVYRPFGRTRLWQRVSGVEVPDWAGEFGADTWARFFIKFSAAHPVVTSVTPATSKPKHMLDNIGAAYGELPDAATQRRMIDFVDALPEA